MDIEKLKLDILNCFNGKNANIKKDVIELKIFTSYYEMIKKCKTRLDVYNVALKMQSEHAAYVSEYERLYKLYSKVRSDDIKSRDILAPMINQYAYSAGAIKIIYDITAAHLQAKTSSKFISTEPKKEEKPKEEQIPSVAVTKSSNQTLKFNGFNKEYLINALTKNYLTLSRLISSKYKEYVLSSFKDEKINKEIFDLVNQRRAYVSELYKDNPMFNEIYTKLLKIEALENEVYFDIDMNKYPVRFDNNLDYYVAIRNSFQNISSLAFAKDKNPLEVISANKYQSNLIASLFGEFTDPEELPKEDLRNYKYMQELSNDIINLITTYDVYSPNRKIISDNKDRKIATNKVTDKSVDHIKSLVEEKTSELETAIGKMLKNKVGITITNHSKSLREKEVTLYEEHFDICKNIITLKRQMSL